MTLDAFSLEGKVALVTGASDGIGQAMAVGLAEAGADVAAVSRSDMTKTAEMIRALGRSCCTVQADLSRMASVESVYRQVMERFGRIDILFNNAGAIRREDSVRFTEQDWDDVMNLNVKVLFFLTQRVARQMIENGITGKIIKTASLLSFQGGIRTPSYTASKSAVRGITMTLANEWAQYGINVNAIAPGYIATKITTALRGDPQRGADILARIPAGRWGTPEDFKGIAVFLASRASDYINGCTIAVDGGWMGR